jgi:hypothetical protein
LNDQQVAGFVSKLSMLLVLLIVGAVVLSRAPSTDDEFVPDEPLVWADVERELTRAERSEKRRGGRTSDSVTPTTSELDRSHPPDQGRSRNWPQSGPPSDSWSRPDGPSGQEHPDPDGS